MKKYIRLLVQIIAVLALSACSNDIVRERVIEIDEKYDKLCAQGPVSEAGELGEASCTEDTSVIAEFRMIVDGIDAQKFTMSSELIEFTKNQDQTGSYFFGLFQNNKPNAAAYYVTVYADGLFQFPEIGTTEMRYLSKDAHVNKFKEVQAFVTKFYTN